MSVFDRMLSPVLALHSKRIQFLSGEPVERRNHIRTNALMRLRVKITQVQIATIYCSVIGGVREGRGVGHHLYPTRNAQIVHPAHDVRRCEIDGGDS